MYRFVGQMTPEDLLAIAAQAQVEMLKAASPAWASSIICTTIRPGRPMPIRRR
jgi:hypothetical protein